MNMISRTTIVTVFTVSLGLTLIVFGVGNLVNLGIWFTVACSAVPFTIGLVVAFTAQRISGQPDQRLELKHEDAAMLPPTIILLGVAGYGIGLMFHKFNPMAPMACSFIGQGIGYVVAGVVLPVISRRRE